MGLFTPDKTEEAVVQMKPKKQFTDQEKFLHSVPGLLFGIMKELQRANALKALELKWRFDEESELTPDDVDVAMKEDPNPTDKRY